MQIVFSNKVSPQGLYQERLTGSELFSRRWRSLEFTRQNRVSTLKQGEQVGGGVGVGELPE